MSFYKIQRERETINSLLQWVAKQLCPVHSMKSVKDAFLGITEINALMYRNIHYVFLPFKKFFVSPLITV
jgi:hypothetical protein